jgi:opacity protein-like surface antigen
MTSSMKQRLGASAGALLVAVLLLAAPTTARAQALEEPRARQGYWLALGLNSGGSRLVEKGKSLGVYQTSGFSLRIGQTLTRAIGVGLAIDYARVKKNADAGGLGNLAMEVSLNPWRNLAVHAGAGLGFVMVTDQNSEEKSLRGGAGTCLLAGASYDFFPWRNRLTGGWAITPTINFRAMPDGDVHAYAVFAGVQVIRWSGLPKNMLVPPE